MKSQSNCLVIFLKGVYLRVQSEAMQISRRSFCNTASLSLQMDTFFMSSLHFILSFWLASRFSTIISVRLSLVANSYQWLLKIGFLDSSQMVIQPSLVVTAISIALGLNFDDQDQSFSSTRSLKKPRSLLQIEIFLFVPEAIKNSPVWWKLSEVGLKGMRFYPTFSLGSPSWLQQQSVLSQHPANRYVC